MPGFRKYHSKTRNGCGQCKKRHVRCNLQAPVCANCKKRKITCDYEALYVNATPDRIPSPELVARRRATAMNLVWVPPRVASSYGAWAPVEFLTSMPCINPFVNERESVSWGWDTVLARNLASRSQDFPYLTHSVLGLAALHARNSPDPVKARECHAAACAHHIEASRLFRRTTRTIDENNWLPTFVFIISVMIFQFSQSQSNSMTAIGDGGPQLLPLSSDPADVLEMFLTLRGTGKIGVKIYQLFTQSPLGPLVKKWVTAQRQALDDKYKVEFARMHEMLDSPPTPPPWSKTYDLETEQRVLRHSIRLLQQWIQVIGNSPQVWLDMIWFPANADSEFIAMVMARHPVAVVLYVHWLAIMSNTPSRWFMDGWAAKTAQASMESLGAEWDPSLAWARSHLGLEPPERPLKTEEDAAGDANRSAGSYFEWPYLMSITPPVEFRAGLFANITPAKIDEVL